MARNSMGSVPTSGRRERWGRDSLVSGQLRGSHWTVVLYSPKRSHSIIAKFNFSGQSNEIRRRTAIPIVPSFKIKHTRVYSSPVQSHVFFLLVLIRMPKFPPITSRFSHF